MTAEIDGDFVVFMTGIEVYRPWKLHKWLPNLFAVKRIIRELEENGCPGYLGHMVSGRIVITYWRSFDELEAYAFNKDLEHWPAWMSLNERIREGSGDMGMWHEMYLVRAGEYQAIYSGMPRTGLGMAGRLVPASGRLKEARERLRRNRRTDSEEAAENEEASSPR